MNANGFLPLKIAQSYTNFDEKMFPFLDTKSHGLPSLNPMMAPMNSINDKSMMNMMPNFDDPVEQSLASLEQSLACTYI